LIFPIAVEGSEIRQLEPYSNFLLMAEVTLQQCKNIDKKRISREEWYWWMVCIVTRFVLSTSGLKNFARS
jgi:hypothetical protein